MQRDDDPTNSTGYTRSMPDASHSPGWQPPRVRSNPLRSAALRGQPRPVLITRRAGRRQDRAGAAIRGGRSGAGRRTATVDLAAEMNAIEFLRLVGHALGVASTSRLGKARLRLEDALANEAAEGRRWLLVVDRAHRGRSGVWDEVQAIANQLGRREGLPRFSSWVKPAWPRSLASRRSSMGLASQVSLHIHLKPLDLDEARDLLDSADVDRVADEGDARGAAPQLTRQHGLAPASAQSCRRRRGDRLPRRPAADRFERDERPRA